jgi:hypothetical protein
MLRGIDDAVATALDAIAEDVESSVRTILEQGVVGAMGASMRGAIGGFYCGAVGKTEEDVPEPLVAGIAVRVGLHDYVVNDPIGKGNYGLVWAAGRVGDMRGHEAVIKEMKFGRGPGILPDATVERAILEAQVMEKLASFKARAPQLLDFQFWPLDPTTPEAFLGRIVMTRCPGQALELWLRARVSARRDLAEEAAHADLVDSYCRSFLDAALSAREVLVQLGPTFMRLNGTIAYHRDVSLANLLVWEPPEEQAWEPAAGAAPTDARKLQFSVIDFGSSVDAKAWRGSGLASWRRVPATGDARYWGPGSWMRFLEGYQALSLHPGLAQQYVRRVDMWALTVTALAAMVRLHTAEWPWPTGSAPPRLPDSPQADPSNVLEARVKHHLVRAIQRVAASWAAIWAVATGSCERLGRYSTEFAAGHQQKAQQAWQEVARLNIPQVLGGKFAELDGHLAKLGKLCQAWSDLDSRSAGSGAGTSLGSSSAWAQVADMLEVVREAFSLTATSPGDGNLTWGDMVARLEEREAQD